jgi:hypothetical protein
LSVLRVTLAAVARQLPPELLEVAEMQCGIVTKKQALNAG